MNLFDAHCHLQDPRLQDILPACLSECRSRGITGWMVNATRESDWNAVADLVATVPGVRASYGLHPWWQYERSENWAVLLEQILKHHPDAAIGETGLDRWMEGHHLPDQIDVLETHLDLARQLDRPISLHCLKAWPELKGVLQRFGNLPRGFLLHSYAAPPDMTEFWVQAGAYFSFSPAFLAARKTAQRAAFQAIPHERLLIETDAPDMAPPQELALVNLDDSEGTHLNHPANLRLCLQTLANDRACSEEHLAEVLLANSQRFFGKTPNQG
jgi:TatD DNase family protein